MSDGAQRLLSPGVVARQLGIPLATLYAWRYKGSGPRALKVGRHLRYRQADVDAWLESCARPGSDEQ